MDDDKPWILLGTPWLDRAGWEPIVKCEFKLMHKDKVITVPLSVHKSHSFLINSKRENLVNILILPSNDLSQKGGSEKKHMSYKELEKKLFDTLNAKKVLNEVCEKFLSFYDELDLLLS